MCLLKDREAYLAFHTQMQLHMCGFSKYICVSDKQTHNPTREKSESFMYLYTQYTHTCILACTHTDRHAYTSTHPSIHPSIHPCMHACMHTYIYMLAYILTHLHAYILTYLCYITIHCIPFRYFALRCIASRHAYIHTYKNTQHIHTYIHTYMHTYIHSYIHTQGRHAYMHTYRPSSYLHTSNASRVGAVTPVKVLLTEGLGLQGLGPRISDLGFRAEHFFCGLSKSTVHNRAACLLLNCLVRAIRHVTGGQRLRSRSTAQLGLIRTAKLPGCRGSSSGSVTFTAAGYGLPTLQVLSTRDGQMIPGR